MRGGAASKMDGEEECEKKASECSASGIGLD